ncbi:hypothetical protein EVAR_28453_1 [Eumeta japonica]|uniref:Uncharacterized protein n=1 Tax=Eumeta variegata TaxID=151549 RepID=A0A4C1V7Y6_EUMVA|nr:hypothetical protein EVAR_28453_1 [Eumeta japonica]
MLTWCARACEDYAISDILNNIDDSRHAGSNSSFCHILQCPVFRSRRGRGESRRSKKRIVPSDVVSAALTTKIHQTLLHLSPAFTYGSTFGFSPRFE